MRIPGLILLVCSSLGLSSAFSQQPGRKVKDIPVREIALGDHLPANAFIGALGAGVKISDAKKLAEACWWG